MPYARDIWYKVELAAARTKNRHMNLILMAKRREKVNILIEENTNISFTIFVRMHNVALCIHCAVDLRFFATWLLEDFWNSELKKTGFSMWRGLDHSRDSHSINRRY